MPPTPAALRCAGVLGLASALLFPGPSPLAQQPPAFRSGVQTVEIYATVVDGAGRLVPELTRDDFEVLDNGRPQPITVFEAGTQRITIAIMLDESPSLFEVAPRVAGAVRALAAQLTPGDRAALGAFSHYVRFDSRLTDDAAAALRRLNDVPPEFPAGTALWDALSDATTALQGETGRRVVLVLTDGNDNASLLEPKPVRARMERDGIMLYAVGVEGQSGLPGGELADTARASGGWFFELRSRDDLDTTFRRVADELHRQYLLGFPAPTLDGRTHRLTVKVKRSGMKARARSTYVAAADAGRDMVGAAVGSRVTR
jgi:Ca-activated chloride channel homolog